jgi:hypothetical protein
MQNARHLAESLLAMGVFELLSANLTENGETLPLVVARFKPDKDLKRLLGFDEKALVHELRTRGWIIPAYTLPKDCEEVQVFRIVVRESVSREMIDLLVDDIKHNVVRMEQESNACMNYTRGISSDSDWVIPPLLQVTLMNRHADLVSSTRAELLGASSPSSVPDPDSDARAELTKKILNSAQPEGPHRQLQSHKAGRGADNSEMHERGSHAKDEQSQRGNQEGGREKSAAAAASSHPSAASSSSSNSSGHSAVSSHEHAKHTAKKAAKFTAVAC